MVLHIYRGKPLRIKASCESLEARRKTDIQLEHEWFAEICPKASHACDFLLQFGTKDFPLGFEIY
jgi:hypothetical protein